MQDPVSIDQQRHKCRELAASNGHELLAEFEFADEAVSGTKLQRDGLNALLEAAEQGQFDVVYFESLSRLARESVITMPLLKKLVYVNRVRIISVSESIDSTNGNWDLLANFLSWHHEQFLKTLRTTVLRGQEGALQAEQSVGDWCFGYGSEPIPGSEVGRKGRFPRPRMRYVVNQDEAAWVRQIFEWFVNDRMSIQAIAKTLTQRNVPKDHRSTRRGWHHSIVRGILSRTKYIGIWPWGKKTNRRNPLTGQVYQEHRPTEETLKSGSDLTFASSMTSCSSRPKPSWRKMKQG